MEADAKKRRGSSSRYLLAEKSGIMFGLGARSRLRNAITRGDLGTVSALLSAGLDVNVRDIRGPTPLMLAVQEGDVDLVRLLLVKGAGANLQDKKGWTAFVRAVQPSNPHPGVEIEELLKACGT